jgi:hypothetical protein
MQAEGLVDGDRDPRHAAVALGSMVEQSLRWWIGQQEPFDPDLALQTLNKLWIRAIGLDRRAPVYGLGKLLLQAQQPDSPVAFTLHSGKIYVEMVVDAIDPSRVGTKVVRMYN